MGHPVYIHAVDFTESSDVPLFQRSMEARRRERTIKGEQGRLAGERGERSKADARARRVRGERGTGSDA